jgi:hypothetical protein
MDREAMKQPEALHLADALDDEFTQGRISNYNGRKVAVELRRLHEVNQDLLKALHEALETEQEPAAWMVYTQDGQSVYVTDNPTEIQENQRALPMYTTPPQRKPLTNGEIYTAYITATNQTLRAQDERLAFAFARAIEAAHGIKEKW